MPAVKDGYIKEISKLRNLACFLKMVDILNFEVYLLAVEPVYFE